MRRLASTGRAELWYNVTMILGKDNIERLPLPVGTSDWATFRAEGIADFENAVEICR